MKIKESNFTSALLKKVLSSLSNNHKRNSDENLYGKEQVGLKEQIYRSVFAKKFTLNSLFKIYESSVTNYESYFEGFQNLYDLLEDQQSKTLLIDLIAFFILQKEKVMLPTNTNEYWKKLEELEKLADYSNTVDANFKNWKLPFMDLSSEGLNLKLHFTPKGVLNCFILKQYWYINKSMNVNVEEGDVVIDAGACWGDTALHFALHAGNKGRVYSFEFIPKNKEIFNKNISLNPDLGSLIELVSHPLAEVSNIKYYYKDKGPGSILRDSEFEGSDGSVMSLSLDDFLTKYELEKIDFIKMDIEGAELPSLKGAVQLLKKYRPKLAISIYHSLDDFVNIATFLNDLNLGYKFYLGHYSIHRFETVLYAKV